MKVAAPVHPGQDVLQETAHIAHLQPRIVVGRCHEQVLGQGELALSQDGVGLGEQFLRLLALFERHVALAA